MISGSINSNVAQRTQFFGMMRCIGAGRRQVIRFVRLEALNWCKTAVPAGTASGVFITWGLCAALRFGIGGEFADIPLFRLSAVGIISGVIVGVVSVLLAAQSPAKRAAKVPPMAAVSGNADNPKQIQYAANTRLLKIETALGVHHAVSAKKNLILMTGSFALSIMLFLSFLAGLDFVRFIMPSLRPWQPDISIISNDGAGSLEKSLINEINEMSGVKHVFGNMCIVDFPVSSGKNVDELTVASYDEYMLNCAKDDLISGEITKVYGDSHYVLTIYNKNNPLRVGDKIWVGDTELIIAGALSDGVFADDVTIICSEAVFTHLTGRQNYTMINIQLTDAVTDNDIDAIRKLAGNHLFSDAREINSEANAVYWAFRLLVYSFLAVIAMITVLYILNSTSMSISARIRQYATMRAVGMDGKQLTKMIAAEVFTYALSGCAAGCALGLPLNRFLFEKLVTAYSGSEWSVPAAGLGIILLIVIVSSFTAIYASSKRIWSIS